MKKKNRILLYIKYSFKVTCKICGNIMAFMGFIAIFFSINQWIESLFKLNLGIKLLIVMIVMIAIVLAIWSMIFAYMYIVRFTSWKILGKNKMLTIMDKIEREQYKGLYVESQIELIKEAKESIRLIIHSLSDENEKKAYLDFDNALSDARARGVDVKILAPDGISRACGAYQLKEKHKLKIRFSHKLEAEDLRFLSTDKKNTIFSQQEKGHVNRLSSRYCKVVSHELGKEMYRLFDDIWENCNTKKYETYIKECIKELPQCSLEEISERLRIPAIYLKKYKK